MLSIATTFCLYLLYFWGLEVHGSVKDWLKDGQGMCFGVENPLVQPESVLIREEQVEILERLCKPEAVREGRSKTVVR